MGGFAGPTRICMREGARLWRVITIESSIGLTASSSTPEDEAYGDGMEDLIDWPNADEDWYRQPRTGRRKRRLWASINLAAS
jgi:hypothetical protein